MAPRQPNSEILLYSTEDGRIKIQLFGISEQFIGKVPGTVERNFSMAYISIYY